MLSALYETRDDERALFGAHWIGPDILPDDWALVARYEPPPASDGQVVEVDCMALPARFYRVRALSGTDSCGGDLYPFTLHTGSDQGWLVAQIAKAVSEGMLVLASDED